MWKSPHNCCRACLLQRRNGLLEAFSLFKRLHPFLPGSLRLLFCRLWRMNLWHYSGLKDLIASERWCPEQIAKAIDHLQTIPEAVIGWFEKWPGQSFDLKQNDSHARIETGASWQNHMLSLLPNEAADGEMSQVRLLQKDLLSTKDRNGHSRVVEEESGRRLGMTL